MNKIVTQAIVLSRVNYGEADRIITVITPDYGKLRLMARGVRKVRSKLAGGIELFSVSTITFVAGRGEIATLVSAQLHWHFSRIVQDINRTMTGYELIKRLHKCTEDKAERAYFDLLVRTFEALDNPDLPEVLIRLWFSLRLLAIGGHALNLTTDNKGSRLEHCAGYGFDYEATAFYANLRGAYKPELVKFLRLGFKAAEPKLLARIGGCMELAAQSETLLRPILAAYLKV